MYLKIGDFKKYIVFILIFIWLALFAHLFYLYITKQGIEKPIKGGVLIEGVIKQNEKDIINPIPYIGKNYYSKYVQSLLFRSCLNDMGSGDLCKVETNDHKTFTVSLSGEANWSDGQKITLDDVYFTYEDVIRKNSLGLENMVFSDISKIEKKDYKLIIRFNQASVNNKSFFKHTILPKHILEGKTKKDLTDSVLKMVNSTCVKLDLNSDYTTNLILDYSKCKDYYINKQQFIILDNSKQLGNFLTGTKKVDLFNGYENVDKEKFKEYKVRLNKRYAFFLNTKKQKDPDLKVFLSNQILSGLKEDLSLSKKMDFNGYGLFQLPKTNLTKEKLKERFEKLLAEQKRKQLESRFIKIGKNNILYYKFGNKKPYYKKEKADYITIKGTLYTGGFSKVTISANRKGEYTLKSYKGKKDFMYVMGEKFGNIHSGKNTYDVYVYTKDGKKVKLDTIVLYYKNLPEQKVNVNYPSFKIVYLNEGLIKNIGDRISEIVKENYPGEVISKSLTKTGFVEELKKKDYDLVVGAIDFEGKDISKIFKTDDVQSNPSLFTNANFSSLINQNLLADKKLKGKIFKELDEIYKKNIPIVIIGNKIDHLYINKKYHPQDLDYSYFENRKKFLKSVVLKKITEAQFKKNTLKGFIEFLKENIK